MSGKIFISYRRSDDAGFAGRLLERLEESFSPDQLFMDVDNIEPGLDFVRVLKNEVERCDVVLAVIGRTWVESRDEYGNRRLDDPNDFVRIEIESALKLDKRIIPILVNNAEMPRDEHLPESLRPLCHRNAVWLTPQRFKSDAKWLVEKLQKIVEQAEASRLAAAKAAEAEEARRREEQATAKAKKLSVKPELYELEDFRDTFPNNLYAAEAIEIASAESAAWDELGETPSLEALEAFLAKFPDGIHTKEARDLRELLEWYQRDGIAREPEPLPIPITVEARTEPDQKSAAFELGVMIGTVAAKLRRPRVQLGLIVGLVAALAVWQFESKWVGAAKTQLQRISDAVMGNGKPATSTPRTTPKTLATPMPKPNSKSSAGSSADRLVRPIDPGVINDPRFKIFTNLDLYGTELGVMSNVSLDQCKDGCLVYEGCQAFSFNPKTQACFLKSDAVKRKPSPGAISGLRQ